MFYVFYVSSVFTILFREWWPQQKSLHAHHRHDFYKSIFQLVVWCRGDRYTGSTLKHPQNTQRGDPGPWCFRISKTYIKNLVLSQVFGWEAPESHTGCPFVSAASCACDTSHSSGRLVLGERSIFFFLNRQIHKPNYYDNLINVAFENAFCCNSTAHNKEAGCQAASISRWAGWKLKQSRVTQVLYNLPEAPMVWQAKDELASTLHFKSNFQLTRS